jgi:hypothetical protein
METNLDNNVVNATEEYLRNQIQEKDERIKTLEVHIQNVTQRDYSTRGELQMMRDNMHDWTVTAIEKDQISEELGEEIAEICGFELTKEVEAEVRVTYYLTLQVPVSEDAEYIINDIDWDAITYDTDKITNVSSTVDHIDF